MLTKRLVGVAVLALAITGYATAASSSRTVTIKGRLKWGSSMRYCVAPRVGSVICVAARGTSAGLGKYEYARDAVGTGGQTSDGCPQYTTRGWLWVKGGKIQFYGTPAPTCGKDAQQPDVSPDANYVLTFRKGSGVLAGATGTATVLAAVSVDIWDAKLTVKHKLR
ncbi:MAG: hypothetical protein QOE29_2200 [Gaiellaceae bacterium]|jgi:hypothetical protein|nr:hypothetical protein [Gaiellaceae bacterium]